MFDFLFDGEKKVEPKPLDTKVEQLKDIAPPPTTQPAQPAQPIQQIAVSSVDPEIQKILEGKLEAANLPGFDYLEYKKTLEATKALPLDEITRMKTALASAQVSGASKEDIIKTASHYISVIDNARNEFMTTFNASFKANVNDKQDQMNLIDKEIEAKALSIKTLTDEIQALQLRKTEINSEVAGASVKLTATKDAFEAAASNAINLINIDIKKLEGI